MQRDLVVKSRNVGKSSDLTLLAPLRSGLVSSLDAVTYKSRVKRLLRALHSGRTRSHEYAFARLISDAVERVGVIQSVRVAVVEPEDKVLLAVSFDGNWDSYLRVLWHKVGALLDVIFCNTEGYVQAKLVHFDDWAAWVRSVQIETSFFYGSPEVTAFDEVYLRRQERQRLRGNLSDLDEAGLRLPSAEARALQLIVGKDTSIDPDLVAPAERSFGMVLRQGLQGLGGLYKLTDLYLPGTDDGATLHRAANELLLEFLELHERNLFKIAFENPKANLMGRFGRQIDWLLTPPPEEHSTKDKQSEVPQWDKTDVQGGIVETYQRSTHGCLLLIGFDSASAAARFIDAIENGITRADTDSSGKPGVIYRNLSFTIQGLIAIGLPQAMLDSLPEEFSQGMASRAGLLGDVA